MQSMYVIRSCCLFNPSTQFNMIKTDDAAMTDTSDLCIHTACMYHTLRSVYESYSYSVYFSSI